MGFLARHSQGKKQIMCIASFTAAILISVIIYAPAQNLVVYDLLMFATGFCSSAYVLSFALLSAQVPPDIHGTAMGFMNMLCILFGAPILQPLIGFILEFLQHDSIIAFQVNPLLCYYFALSLLPLSFLMACFFSFWVREPN